MCDKSRALHRAKASNSPTVFFTLQKKRPAERTLQRGGRGSYAIGGSGFSHRVAMFVDNSRASTGNRRTPVQRKFVKRGGMDGAIVGSFLQTRPGAHRPLIYAGPSPFRGSADVLYVSKNHIVNRSRSIPRKMAVCYVLLSNALLRLLVHHVVASSVGGAIPASKSGYNPPPVR